VADAIQYDQVCGHALARCQECSAHLCHRESATGDCDRGEGPRCDCL